MQSLLPSSLKRAVWPRDRSLVSTQDSQRCSQRLLCSLTLVSIRLCQRWTLTSRIPSSTKHWQRVQLRLMPSHMPWPTCPITHSTILTQLESQYFPTLKRFHLASQHLASAMSQVTRPTKTFVLTHLHQVMPTPRQWPSNLRLLHSFRWFPHHTCWRIHRERFMRQ